MFWRVVLVVWGVSLVGLAFIVWHDWHHAKKLDRETVERFLADLRTHEEAGA